ncbi:MAG: choice-of-anchor tandem repeat GloVer-containing protein [Luteolibacter sp.]|uniref:choice-of-anchor tandem repeat GloVer-containing protein n=1 Tax=Luteolibacter sp. TaxID=1962973 RepID=UPI003267148F
MNSTIVLSFSLVRRLSLSLIACHFTVQAMLASPVFEPLQAYDGPTLRRESKLFQAADGSLYGVTVSGGATNFGTLFKLAPDRTLTVLENLSLGTIWNARSPLTQGPESDLYGTSGNGGTNNAGTIFRLATKDGTRTTLHHFNRTDGYFPVGSLVKADNGYYYGVTSGGGTGDLGTVFRMSPNGSITTLQSLNYSTGYYPKAGLTNMSGTQFLGTATYGGANNYGSIFKIDSLGALSVLVNFTGNNGAYPTSELVKGGEAAGGNYYGTTDGGGAYGDGTAFVMTPSGQLTTLYSFKDGLGPKYAQPGLALGPDGNFYSVTNEDGSGKSGTVYRMTPGGVISVIVNFNGANGSYPDAPLAVGIDGNLYGATSADGTTSGGKRVKGGQIFRIRFGPGAVTKEAGTILTTSCSIKGLFNPGQFTTNYWFQYGTSPTLANSTTFAKRSVSGNNRDNTFSAKLSGLKPGTTYYYRAVASNAENPFPQTGLILSFTTLPASTPAADLWRIQYFNQSPNTGNAADNADPDQDNVPNLLERAFNLSPIQSDTSIVVADTGITGLPNIRATGDAGNLRLRIEYLRRTASSNAGLDYLPQSCNELGSEDDWTPLIGPETVTPINADWERVVIEEEAGGNQPQHFGRLKISTQP